MELIENICSPREQCPPMKVKCIAHNVVDQAVCTANELIKLDPGELFLYKRPKVYPLPNAVSYAESYSTSSSDEALKTGNIDWVSIEDFSHGEAMNQIRDYIGLWVLTPATKFVLISPREPEVHLPLGTRHFVDALFSKPTPKCPNPLAVAKVNFYVHVSAILPPDYPIMVTYRFEGYKTSYYALGRRCLRSIQFQRFFIDSILQMKLTFYAEMCECRNPRDEKERVVVMRRQSDTEHDIETTKKWDIADNKSVQSMSAMSARSFVSVISDFSGKNLDLTAEYQN